MLQPSNAAGKLDSLLGEINILATQYKQGRQPFQNEGDWAGGVRGVLVVLGRSDGQTVPEIARARGTSRQNIQIVVNRLKMEGLAELAPNPTHKRSALVRLTEKGKVVVQQIELAEAKLFQDVLAALSPEELVSATKCLRRLRHLLAAGSSMDPTAEKPTGAFSMQPALAQDKQPQPMARSDEKRVAEEEDAFPVSLL